MKRVILNLIDWIKSFFKKKEQEVDPFNRAEPIVRDYVFSMPDPEPIEKISIKTELKPKTILDFNPNDYVMTVTSNGKLHKLTTKQFWLYQQFENDPMHFISGNYLAKRFIQHKYLNYSKEEIQALPIWMRYYGGVLHKSMIGLIKKGLVVKVNDRFKFNGNAK